MAEAFDHGSDSFERSFHPRTFANVCVLAFPRDFHSSDSEALSVLNTGVESMVRAGIEGFVFDRGFKP